MAQVSAKIIVVIATAVALSLTGIGYALDYSGVTHGSSADYNVKYVMVVVNEGGPTALTETFDFGTPTYFTDRVVKTHTVSYRVVDYQGVDTATIELTGNSTEVADMFVSLEEALPAYATITLQFYVHDTQSGTDVEHGDPIVLSGTPTAVSEPFDVGTTYYCEATLDITSFSDSSAPEGFTAEIVFMASADTEAEP